MATMGIEQRTPGPKTNAAKLVGALKSRETRKLRAATGKRRRG